MNLVTESFGPFQSLLQLQPLHVSLLASLAAFALTLLLLRGVLARGILRRRVQAHASLASVALTSDDVERRSWLMAQAAKLLLSVHRSTDSQLKKLLVQAGFFSDLAGPIFYASRALCAAGLPILGLLLLPLLPFDLPVAMMTGALICVALLGLILPPVLLDRLIKRTQQRYRDAFPDFMDLLVVCVEAGQSLQSAIASVGQEMLQLCPPLGFNIHLLSLELRAGSTLHSALLSLYGRAGIKEVQSLAVLLKQSEELGASIAGALRTFSDEMRDKRVARAETRANTLPVKMTIPLGLCIFPVILLVILVPVVIRIKNAFV